MNRSSASLIGLVCAHRSALAVLLCAALQQCIVASSTIWLAWATERFAAGQSGLLWAGLYSLSMLLPYAPGAVSFALLPVWQHRMLHTFVERFCRTHGGRLDLHENAEERARKTPLLSSNAKETFRETSNYLLDTANCAISVALNTIALAYVLDPLIAATLGLGCLAALAVLKLQQQKTEQLAQQTQESSIALTNQLNLGWDNVLIGNVYNKRLWQEAYEKSLRNAEINSRREIAFTQTATIGVTITAFLPTLALLLWNITYGQQGPSYAAIAVVSLPRVFQILNLAQVVFSSVATWPSIKARLGIIIEGSNAGETIDLGRRVRWNDITLWQHGHAVAKAAKNYNCLSLLQNVRHTRSAGLPAQSSTTGSRIALRGNNGTGKSSVLKSLKMELDTTAYYLPAQHALAFKNVPSQASTGEHLVAALAEIEQMPNPPQLLLLDEWDANLDARNMAALDAQIARLSERMAVVEVRHRG